MNLRIPTTKLANISKQPLNFTQIGNVDVRMKLDLFEVQKFHFTKTVIYIKVM